MTFYRINSGFTAARNIYEDDKFIYILLRKNKQQVDIYSPEIMKLLNTYIYQYQAQLDYIKLKDEGIDAVLEDENTVSIAPLFAKAVGEIKLFVKENEYEKAKEILKTYEYEYLDKVFPEEEIEQKIKCPKCGSMNVERKSSLLGGIFLLVLFFVPATVKKRKYICLDCNYQWRNK